MDENDKDKIETMFHAVRGTRMRLECQLHGSYRELSIAKTKLEEAEMWLDKLLKGVL